MNAAKMTLMATVLAAAFGLALGLMSAPAVANHDCSDPKWENHSHCGGGGGSEDPEPTLGMCPASPCIADVGKTFTDNTPARQFAVDSGGTYTKIKSNEFDRILERDEPALDLCEAYDVLIFNWSSPTIKNLNWQRLLDYMACDGNVIFEDPRNVGLLAAGVSTLETTLHSRGDFPLTITLENVGPLNGNAGPLDLVFVNKHIIFDDNSSNGLLPFLSLPNSGDEVVGLYGEFGDGRIVLTGPDNNYHGDPDEDTDDPADDARMNHYNLLFNEINWLLN